MKCQFDVLLFLILILKCGVILSRIRIPSANKHSSEIWSHELATDSERIVGGRSAKTILPYHVALQVNFLGVWIEFCGGAIISEDYILTAAHCAQDYERTATSVLAGTRNKYSGERHSVAHIYMHPKYDGEFPFPNDIAVMQVEPPFDFQKSRFIKPISIGREFVPANVRVRVAGWGKYKNIAGDLDYPEELQVLDQKTIPNRLCELQWVEHNQMAMAAEGSIISSAQLCTSKTSGTCQGDSGGSLVTIHTKTPQLVGIVSYGTDECGNDMPDVYTRVSSYLPFIHAVINGRVEEKADKISPLDWMGMWD